jgi:hypothetical protein
MELVSKKKKKKVDTHATMAASAIYSLFSTHLPTN